MQFQLLGPVEIWAAGGRVSLPRRQDRCLLAVLLLYANQAVAVGQLAELLWDGNPPDRSRRSIHGQVSRLRAVLAGAEDPDPAVVSTMGESYRIEVDPQAVDVFRFRAMVDEAARVDDLADRVDQIRFALDLWRGPALTNAASTWMHERLCGELEGQRLDALEDLLAASLQLRREREILPELARTAAAHPGRESLAQLHMQALYQADRKADALEVFARTRAYLAGELGLDPSPRLRELHQAILREEVETPEPPGPVRAAARGPAPPVPPVVVPRQLPPDVTGFSGRSRQLAALDALLPTTGGDSGGAGPVVITAISGTAGVGKTALAVHWAHRTVAHFPDGQLYLDLRGFDPTGTPMDPAAAVRCLLDALQVPATRIPAGLDAQVGLYRSLLTDRRMLVVLDNARDADQVRPLLPGAPGCLAVVTSRNQLSGLVAGEGARPVTLDLLPIPEARDLLASRIGAARVAAEPAAVEELIRRCAQLPLALAVVATRAATHPHFPLHSLVGELREAGSGLAGMGDPDPSTDLRAVFSWSYHALSPPAARLFRLLGLHPGPDFSASAAASLVGEPVPTGRPLLAELARAHLVTEHAPGRFGVHDLLRIYASELVHTVDGEADRQAGRHRLVDHYVRGVYAARELLDPHRAPPYPLEPAPPDVVAVEIDNWEQATAWLAVEHPVLLNVIDEAVGCGLDAPAWQLAVGLGIFHYRHGYGGQYLATQRVALLAAQRLADPSAEAMAHSGTGNAHFLLADYDRAREHLQRAADLHGECGDRVREAYGYLNLAALAMRQERQAEMLRSAEHAHALLSHAGDLPGQARALNLIGWAYALQRHYQKALVNCEKALTIQQEAGDVLGAGITWDSLGYVHHQLGDQQQAAASYHQALDIYHQHEYRYGRAETLTRLGDSYLAVGAAGSARDAWQQALDLFLELGDPDADGVRARLERLDRSP